MSIDTAKARLSGLYKDGVLVFGRVRRALPDLSPSEAAKRAALLLILDGVVKVNAAARAVKELSDE